MRCNDPREMASNSQIRIRESRTIEQMGDRLASGTRSYLLRRIVCRGGELRRMSMYLSRERIRAGLRSRYYLRNRLSYFFHNAQLPRRHNLYGVLSKYATDRHTHRRCSLAVGPRALAGSPGCHAAIRNTCRLLFQGSGITDSDRSTGFCARRKRRRSAIGRVSSIPPVCVTHTVMILRRAQYIPQRVCPKT